MVTSASIFIPLYRSQPFSTRITQPNPLRQPSSMSAKTILLLLRKLVKLLHAHLASPVHGIQVSGEIFRTLRKHTYHLTHRSVRLSWNPLLGCNCPCRRQVFPRRKARNLHDQGCWTWISNYRTRKALGQGRRSDAAVHHRWAILTLVLNPRILIDILRCAKWYWTRRL